MPADESLQISSGFHPSTVNAEEGRAPCNSVSPVVYTSSLNPSSSPLQLPESLPALCARKCHPQLSPVMHLSPTALTHQTPARSRAPESPAVRSEERRVGKE